jgi:hypothetical protein
MKISKLIGLITISEKVQFVLISKDIIIALSGCAILLILYRDLIKYRKAQRRR